jgi:hypothetical protein
MLLSLKSFRRACAMLATALLLAQTAHAGLPLLCNPFQTGNADLLPWKKDGGRFDYDRRYDARNMTADILRLLSKDTPTLARMENLRRASVYAMENRAVANDLLKALLERTKSPEPGSRDAALAWFDAGYLIESYRQQGMTHEVDLLAAFDQAYPGVRNSAANGYALVQKAIAITHEPDMEYAASLMTLDASASTRHRAAAAAGAAKGSLLASNLQRAH